jgi:hypothetical protein
MAILFYPELFKQHGTYWYLMQYFAIFTTGNLFPNCVSVFLPGFHGGVPKHFGFKISQMLDFIMRTTVNVTSC